MMIEITKIKILRDGGGKLGVLPVSIEVEDLEEFRDEIKITLDWRQKDETENDKV